MSKGQRRIVAVVHAAQRPARTVRSTGPYQVYAVRLCAAIGKKFNAHLHPYAERVAPAAEAVGRRRRLGEAADLRLHRAMQVVEARAWRPAVAGRRRPQFDGKRHGRVGVARARVDRVVAARAWGAGCGCGERLPTTAPRSRRNLADKHLARLRMTWGAPGSAARASGRSAPAAALPGRSWAA